MNRKEMVEYFNKNMPELSGNEYEKEIKKALYFYLELGKQKAFDEKYYYGDTKIRKKIYEKGNNEIRNLDEVANKRKIICTTLSYLYADILNANGIRAKVMRTSLEDRHTYVVIFLKDGRHIKADLQQDLYNIHTQSRIKEFASSENREEGYNYISKNELTQYLIELGYINSEHDYRDEKIERVKDEIKFLNVNDALDKIVKDKDVYENNNAEIVEARKFYYKTILMKLMPQYLKKKVFLINCYRENNGKREYTMCLYSKEKDDLKIYLYSNERKRFLEVEPEQMQNLENEGLVLGNYPKEMGVKLLKKSLKKIEKKNLRMNATSDEFLCR